jgi:hypothetical protein
LIDWQLRALSSASPYDTSCLALACDDLTLQSSRRRVMLAADTLSLTIGECRRRFSLSLCVPVPTSHSLHRTRLSPSSSTPSLPVD